ncbi:hypothetical protein, partial [Natronogracilivirga saccharolytica]
MGYGNQNRSYVMLSGFYARDDEGSIDVPDSFFDEQQDPEAGFGGGTGRTRRNFSPPAENLLVSPEFQVSLFG